MSAQLLVCLETSLSVVNGPVVCPSTAESDFGTRLLTLWIWMCLVLSRWHRGRDAETCRVRSMPSRPLLLGAQLLVDIDSAFLSLTKEDHQDRDPTTSRLLLPATQSRVQARSLILPHESATLPPASRSCDSMQCHATLKESPHTKLPSSNNVPSPESKLSKCLDRPLIRPLPSSKLTSRSNRHRNSEPSSVPLIQYPGTW